MFSFFFFLRVINCTIFILYDYELATFFSHALALCVFWECQKHKRHFGCASEKKHGVCLDSRHFQHRCLRPRRLSLLFTLHRLASSPELVRLFDDSRDCFWTERGGRPWASPSVCSANDAVLPSVLRYSDMWSSEISQCWGSSTIIKSCPGFCS